MPRGLMWCSFSGVLQMVMSSLVAAYLFSSCVPRILASSAVARAPQNPADAVLGAALLELVAPENEATPCGSLSFSANWAAGSPF